LFHGIHHILHGAHCAESFRFNFTAGTFLQMNHHIDGINAVEFEIFIQTCLGMDILRRNFKQAGQQRSYFLIDLFFVHHKVVSAFSRAVG